MVVHDVEVNEVSTRSEYVVYFFAKTGEIGRKNRWGNSEGLHDAPFSELNTVARMYTARLDAHTALRPLRDRSQPSAAIRPNSFLQYLANKGTRRCLIPHLTLDNIYLHEGKGMPKSYNSKQLLKGRYSEPGRIYMLTTVTDQRRPVFSDFHLGRLVVNQLRQAHDEGIVNSLAWVVMPDHCHWLVELRTKSLGELMCRIKSRSSVAVNLATQSTSRLWQKGYHDRALRREDDLKAAARYLIQNPIRAQLTSRIGDYPLWDACWI
ncbi:transposase [Mycobacterium sp. MBM]|nr:transposase [Mycobacterium sp. MBM]